MAKSIICREVAEVNLSELVEAWGLVDDDAILSGGTETSIPEEVKKVLTSAIMIGELEITNSGKTIKQNIGSNEFDLTSINYVRDVKAHMITGLDGDDLEKTLKLAAACTDVPVGQLSGLGSRSLKVLSSLMALLAF